MPNVSWEDIGGLENVKRELQEVLLLQMVAIYVNLMTNYMIMLRTCVFAHVDGSISSGAS